MILVRMAAVAAFAIGGMFAGDAMAQSCGAASSEGFAGGFIVSRTCGGTRISGVGTYVDDAVNNANGFAGLLSSGLWCRTSTLNVEQNPGVIHMDFNCGRTNNSGGSFGTASIISAVGTTATDVGVNALGLASLYAATEYRCGSRSGNGQALAGGFLLQYACAKAGGPFGAAPLVSGIGSTASDAAANGLGFSELYATRGDKCTTSSTSISLVGLAFSVRFSCTNGAVTGYGSTLTAAGNDALAQAQGR